MYTQFIENNVIVSDSDAVNKAVIEDLIDIQGEQTAPLIPFPKLKEITEIDPKLNYFGTKKDMSLDLVSTRIFSRENREKFHEYLLELHKMDLDSFPSMFI